jgi:hypothetical protein
MRQFAGLARSWSGRSSPEPTIRLRQVTGVRSATVRLRRAWTTFAPLECSVAMRAHHWLTPASGGGARAPASTTEKAPVSGGPWRVELSRSSHDGERSLREELSSLSLTARCHGTAWPRRGSSRRRLGGRRGSRDARSWRRLHACTDACRGRAHDDGCTLSVPASVQASICMYAYASEGGAGGPRLHG